MLDILYAMDYPANVCAWHGWLPAWRLAMHQPAHNFKRPVEGSLPAEWELWHAPVVAWV